MPEKLNFQLLGCANSQRGRCGRKAGVRWGGSSGRSQGIRMETRQQACIYEPGAQRLVRLEI